MSYQGKQTTMAGTLFKCITITPEPSAEFNISKVLITTNEIPLNNPDSNFIGWFYNADEMLNFYSKSSKVYQQVKTLFQQKNNNNPAINNACVGISYVNITDATNTYIITKNIEDRLNNFVPQQGEYLFKGKLNILSGKNSINIGAIELTKKPTLEELASELNKMSGQAYFEVISVDNKKELKISTLFIGSEGLLEFHEVPQEQLTYGCIDIGGSNYLNIIDESGYDKTNGVDSVLNQEDYFSSLLRQLRDNGINPRTLMTSCILSAKQKVAINNELETLYQNTNDNICACFVSSLTCEDEVKEFNDSFNSQPMHIVVSCAKWMPLSSLILASSSCANFVVNNIDNIDRYDGEWSSIIVDDEYYFNQKGVSNEESNNITKDGYVECLQFNGEGIGLILRGNEKSWSLAMHSAYIQIVNLLPIKLGNFMAGQISKTKNEGLKSSLLAELKRYGKNYFDRNYLSNQPLESDMIVKNLDKKRQLDISEIGWSPYIKPLNLIEGNKIPFEVVCCLGGIIASFTQILKVTDNV